MADEVTVVVNAVLNNDKFKKALKDSKTTAEKTTKNISSGIDKLKGAYFLLAGVITGVVVSAFKSLVNLTARLEAQAKAAATVFGEDTANAMKFVKDESKRLGLEIEKATGAFIKIAAAAKGTSLEGEGVKEVFSGVSEAATALQLNSEQTEGALRALEQIISKGKVQAEELRGQLGERLPGAFQIAARAMGVTTKELDKLMSTGQITAEEFVPKFAKQLRKEFGGAAEDAAKSFQAARNRLSNSFKTLATIAGSVLLPPLTELVSKLNELLVPVTKIVEKMVELNNKFKIGAKLLGTFVFGVKLLANAIKISLFQAIGTVIGTITFMAKLFKNTIMAMIADVKSFGRFFKDVFTGKGIEKSFKRLTKQLAADAKEFTLENKKNAKEFGNDFTAPFKRIAGDMKTFVKLMSGESEKIKEKRKSDAKEVVEAEQAATAEIIASNKDRIDLLNFLGDERAAKLLELETQRNELLKKFADQRVEIEEATEAKKRAIMAESAMNTLQQINTLQGQIQGITQSFFDNEITRSQQKADKDTEILKKQKEDGLITEEQFNAKKEKIEKDAAKEEAKIRKKAAIAAKIGGLFDVALNTAVGIAKSVATSPLTGGLPWSAIIAGIGVAQAAAIAAKPLPEVPGFAGGVQNFAGGVARINEQGGELINLPGGSNVLTNAATKDLLFNGGGQSKVSNINTTTNNDNSQRNYTFNGIRDIGMARNKLLRSEGKGAFA
jgi:tape measure domain-containing protein